MAVRREDRVADEVKRILAKSIQRDLKDPRVPPFTSVTDVKVTRDFSYATCFVSVLGSPDEQKACLEALEKSKGFLRSKIAKQLTIRVTPELRFKLDDTYERAKRIDQLIDSAIAKDRAADQASAAEVSEEEAAPETEGADEEA